MEVTTEAQGTKLRIETDRQFDGSPGDSTLRINGQTREGSQVFDATYVETTPDEAALVGWFLRAMRQPPPELQDKLTQEVQAAFSSCLSGRDAHQITELAWQGIATAARDKLGGGREQYERIEHLAERFDRASARARQPVAPGMAGRAS